MVGFTYVSVPTVPIKFKINNQDNRIFNNCLFEDLLMLKVHFVFDKCLGKSLQWIIINLTFRRTYHKSGF